MCYVLFLLSDVLFLQFKAMLRSYCKSEATELDCLHALEDFAFEESDFAAIAKNSIHLLYDLEIVSEDAILLWYEEKGSKDDGTEQDRVEFAAKIRQNVKPLIEWLQEDEESDDDSD